MFDIVLNSPAYIIYLESYKERKEYAYKNITEAGFTNIQLFNAVNGKDSTDIENTMNLFPGIKIDKEPNAGQTGCLLSHLKLLKHIIDNQVLISTIFEDDVYFHPKWKELAKKYFNYTPKNFDIIFIGNQIDEPKKYSKLNTADCFCTHAYIITLQGAQRLLNALINWDYQNFSLFQPGWNLTGLYNIDIMIKNIQMRVNNKQLPKKFIWYCWNGIYHECDSNKFPLDVIKSRNTGLVFQSSDFISLVTII